MRHAVETDASVEGDASLPEALPPPLAAALVFVAAGAVLMLEILAVRLLAPYVGLTLETTTAIIGAALGGIAAGAALGGYFADRTDTRLLVVGLFIAGGLLTLLTVPVVRWLGPGARGGGAQRNLSGRRASAAAQPARLLPPTAAAAAAFAALALGGLSASSTTREWTEEVQRVLEPGGLYAMNVIDHLPLDLASAEAATLRDVFSNVRLISYQGPNRELFGGNLVFLASDKPLSRTGSNAKGGITYDESAAGQLASEADVLRDDFAPADQLLTTSN
jgi:hypothetical protein